MSRLAEELLPYDAWCMVFGYLQPTEVSNAALACKCFAAAAREAQLWHQLCDRKFGSHPAAKCLQFAEGTSWRNRFRHMLKITQVQEAVWTRTTLTDRNSAHWFPPCEGHAVALFEDRYGILFGAYTDFGIITDVCAFDLQDLPESIAPVNVELVATPAGFVQVDPSSVYGHTLTPIGNGQFLRYGGCLYGGYRGATADPVVIQLAKSEEGGLTCFKYKPAITNADAAYAFGPSSYHAVHQLPGHPSKLLFFGGLEDGGPHNRVALLDTETWTWLPVQVDDNGQAPRGRYGFASGIVSDKLWILGGCNGHDIRRSGRDLRDVFSLDLSQLDAEQGGTVVWTNHQLQVPEHTFGRETCNVVFGSKIVAFGGSVAHMRADEVTDNVYWFDTETLEFGEVAQYAEGGDRRARPKPSLSNEALLVHNQYMAIISGYTVRNLLPGIKILNLCPNPEELEQVKRDSVQLSVLREETEQDEDSDEDPHEGREDEMRRFRMLMMLFGRG